MADAVERREYAGSTPFSDRKGKKTDPPCSATKNQRIHHLRMRRSGTDRTDTRCSGDRYPHVRKGVAVISKRFEEKILEGQLQMKGRIVAACLLWQAWKIYRNPDVRKTLKKIR